MQQLKTYYSRDSKAKQITLVWACTENGRKQDSQEVITYEYGINKAKGQTEKQMARRSEEGWKTSWWNWVEGRSTQWRGMEEAPEIGGRFRISINPLTPVCLWI